MAYRHLGTETGTEPVKCKINERHITYIEAHNLIFNAVVNLAVYNLVYDLQTDKLKATWQMQQGNRASRWAGDKNIIKAARVRRDLLEYLRMNCYNVNGSINLALSRLIQQWDGNEAKANFSYPLGVTRNKAEAHRESGRYQNVCPKVTVTPVQVEEPNKIESTQGNKDIQPTKVHYLQDPCNFAVWHDGWTEDCCGHCKYYAEPDSENPTSYCTRDGKR